MTVVNDIITLMEDVAPAHLAQEWDNSGLQCGDRNWPVKRVMVALDPSQSVISEACKNNTDMLITHHPLIFRPLKSLILDTPLGKMLDLSIRHRLAIFSAHTNLDSARGGLNDVFAEKIGLKNLTLLAGEKDHSLMKLAVYVPETYCQTVFNAILETDAGIIGNYTGCTFRQKGVGTFIPDSDATPFIGTPNTLESVSECRIEMSVSKNRIPGILNHIRQHHPYETMAYDIYPLYADKDSYGIGRVGELEEPTTLAFLSEKIKKEFALSALKISGVPDMPVQKIAVCTGSGSGLLKQFFGTNADVYISGDLKFHDAKDAEANGRGLIDVGHFASEVLMIDLVARRLETLAGQKGLDIAVDAFHEEKDPFKYV